MTGDRLRELAQAATPGPWTWTHHERGPWQVGTVIDEDEHQVGGYLDFTELDDQALTLVDFICEGGESSSAHARLIALAPDMAVLLADAIDALAGAPRKSGRRTRRYDGDPYMHAWYVELDALLARFRALGDHT